MDVTSYLLGKKSAGGGEAPTLINKNITANGTYNASDDNADGYKKVVVDVSQSGGRDWSAIGYSSEPQIIVDGYNYAIQIKNNWDATQEYLIETFRDDYNIVFFPLVDTSKAINVYRMFMYCRALDSVPLIDTSNVGDMRMMFYECSGLKDVPILNTSKVTNFTQMFLGCYSLSDQTIDNILQMCINATIYTGVKTLSQLGFNSTRHEVERIQALPHYQDFIDAGWTIGY